MRKEKNPFPHFPNLCLSVKGGYTDGQAVHLGWSHNDDMVMHQYERLARASRLNQDAAIMACSWGMFQVLALYYEDYGYTSPQELENSTMKGIDGHFDLFVAFIKSNHERVKMECQYAHEDIPAELKKSTIFYSSINRNDSINDTLYIRGSTLGFQPDKPLEGGYGTMCIFEPVPVGLNDITKEDKFYALGIASVIKNHIFL